MKSLHESQALPEHVIHFDDIERKLDVAVRKGDEQETEKVRKELDLFLGSLNAEQQEAIRIYLIQQNAGRRVEQYRSGFHKGVSDVLQFPVVLMKTAADTLPPLAEETLRLIVSTVGLTIRGVITGVQETFRKAA